MANKKKAKAKSKLKRLVVKKVEPTPESVLVDVQLEFDSDAELPEVARNYPAVEETPGGLWNWLKSIW